MHRAKLLVVVPTLGLGGVERALGSVLRHVDRERFEPTLCVLGTGIGELAPPADVPVIALGRRSRWSFCRLVLRLRRVVEGGDPDVILTFSGTANLVALAATFASRHPTPVVVTEHIAPLQMYGGPEEPFGWIKKLLIRILYRRAAAVVAVSRGVADELRQLGIPDRLLTIVHTPVELNAIEEAAADEAPEWPTRGPVVVSVGRMSPQKNQHLLLDALAILQQRVATAVVLVGDGPLRGELELAARRHELDAIFAGADTNPYRWIKRADVFVLSSNFEGFGVVLVEALALGVPVVSTDCPSGPREILDGGAYGILTPTGDPHALAAAIQLVLTDKSRAAALSASGPARAAVFSGERATRALEAVISSAARPTV